MIIETINGGTPPYQSQNGVAIVDSTALGPYPIGSNSETIFDTNGCETTVDFEMTPTAPLSATLAETLPIKLGESIPLPLDIQGVVSTILWTPSVGLSCTDCPNPMASPVETTSYTVTIADDNACQWSGEIVVVVDFQGLYIPNAFSPNEDGNNDAFQPYWSESVQEIVNFEIYDRWGSQVYVSTAGAPVWNGKIGSRIAGEGVYVYFIQWEDKAGQKHTEQGELLLIR